LNSVATGVWCEGKTLFVSGDGINDETGRNEALLWSRAIDGSIADFDGDGAVTASDLALLLGAWGSAPAPGCFGDLNLNSAVDAADLATLLGDWT